jgi:hypothetical protein
MAHVRSSTFVTTIPDPIASIDNAFDATGCDFIRATVSWHSAGAHVLTNAPTYNAVALTAFGPTITQGSLRQRMYYLVGPTTGSNTFAVLFDDGVSSNNVIIVVEGYVDIDPGAAPDGYTTAQGTTTTAAVTIDSETGDLPVFAMSARCLDPGSTAPTNYDERYDTINTAGASSGHLLVGGGDGTGATSVAFSAAITATGVNDWIAMGVNLNAAAGGPVAPTFITPTPDEVIDGTYLVEWEEG